MSGIDNISKISLLKLIRPFLWGPPFSLLSLCWLTNDECITQARPARVFEFHKYLKYTELDDKPNTNGSSEIPSYQHLESKINSFINRSPAW